MVQIIQDSCLQGRTRLLIVAPTEQLLFLNPNQRLVWHAWET